MAKCDLHGASAHQVSDGRGLVRGTGEGVRKLRIVRPSGVSGFSAPDGRAAYRPCTRTPPWEREATYTLENCLSEPVALPRAPSCVRTLALSGVTAILV